MKLSLIMVLFLSFSISAEENMTQYAYNLSCVHFNEKENKNSTSNGVAVAVDMSQYGLNSKRCLITAWHLIDHKDSDTMIDIPIGKIRCKLLFKDVALDVAVIECNLDVPNICKLDDAADIDLKTILTNVGSPLQVGPVAVSGELIDKGDMVRSAMNWVAKAPGFYHGSSGGAMFHNGKYFGTCVSGIYDGEDPMGMKKGFAVFVPIKRVKSFLRDYQEEQSKEKSSQ